MLTLMTGFKNFGHLRLTYKFVVLEKSNYLNIMSFLSPPHTYNKRDYSLTIGPPKKLVGKRKLKIHIVHACFHKKPC